MSKVTIDPETGEILEGETPGVELRPDDDLAEDEDPDAARETPPEDPPPPPLSERELEQAMKKLDGEQKRHQNRLREIMGDDFDAMLPCELCDPTFAGFRFDQPVPEQQREAIAQAIGLTGELGMIDDPETRQCPYCEGMGETITGSKVQNQTTRACPKCSGNGWMNLDQWNAYESTARARDAWNVHQPEQPLAASDHDVLPGFDAWTRPRGHEFYGTNPVYMTPEQRARDWPGAQ